MKSMLLIALSLAVATLAPATVTAQTFDARDSRLALDVSQQLRSYPQITIFDYVDARVENGVVVLDGKVTMPFKRNDLGRRIAAIDGVRDVQNRIEVLPVSSFDADLRHRIARAIYGNPSFWNYAAMAQPPIRIIVENGRVTLRGVVGSNVERVLARSLAVGSGELSVVNELRTDAEMQQAATTGSSY
jgi:osmotically-inducible protein OsmY